MRKRKNRASTRPLLLRHKRKANGRKLIIRAELDATLLLA
jgi:hypothetical protein